MLTYTLPASPGRPALRGSLLTSPFLFFHPNGAYFSCHFSCVVYLVLRVFHLWNFDRFKCLRWNSGPYTGAFKRIMTYTYFLTIPLICVYAIGFAIIKYKMGYSIIPGQGIIPTPWQLWPKSYQHAIFPLQLCLSIGWSFELVTHLEELCFWLFLINAGSVQQDWFRSLYFKTWVVGSVVAILYMPIVTIFTRSDPLKCEAFSFLAGSLGGLSLTLWFMPVLWTFPSFLGNLRKEGVDMSTMVRLTTFYELNSIRVVFRFLFVAPLLVLGVDGVRPHQHINESGFWTELLTIIGGIGCVVSSGLTLVIFFPRNRQSEVTAKSGSKQDRSAHMRTYQTTSMMSDRESVYEGQSFAMKSVGFATMDYPDGDATASMYGGEDTPSPVHLNPPESDPGHGLLARGASFRQDLVPEPESSKAVVSFIPNRRADGGRTVEGTVKVIKLAEDNKKHHDRRTLNPNVHPLVHNFTSPIGTYRLEMMQTDMTANFGLLTSSILDLVSGPRPNISSRGR
ncbi:hypothetical protein EUX98_g4644 [Antrodiella citrinella]|uniref:Uncharacterized protein n=1 Tax=Antrodiella citrinella TaxID=2447956 RepID=A0A4S4MTL7_9APHY|nr:hypothetical protein EUX98_g4644 [Antrodiella citrinella]